VLKRNKDVLVIAHFKGV